MTFEVQTGPKCSHPKPYANGISLIFSLAFQWSGYYCAISFDQTTSMSEMKVELKIEFVKEFVKEQRDMLYEQVKPIQLRVIKYVSREQQDLVGVSWIRGKLSTGSKYTWFRNRSWRLWANPPGVGFVLLPDWRKSYSMDLLYCQNKMSLPVHQNTIFEAGENSWLSILWNIKVITLE